MSLAPGEMDRVTLDAPRPRSRVPQFRDGASRLARHPPRWWSAVALAVLLLVGAVVLVYETRGTLFWVDEWSWILNRRGGGLDTFLQPHNEHLSLVPLALYKLLFAVVGLRHYWPYRGMLIGAELICTVLIFVYLRRRVGGFYALLAAAVILFFGPGWQDILWPFQTPWILCVAAGVGALMALDRDDRVGDITASLLLALSLASTSVGVAIAAGLIVEVLWRRPRRDLWIVAVPVALYVLWWATYQQTSFTPHALLLVPRFVLNSAAGTLGALTGLVKIDVYTDAGDYLSVGVPLLVLALGAIVWRLRALGRIPPRVATLGTILLAFWLLTGVGRAYVISAHGYILVSTGHESRYLYVGAAYSILLMAELACGTSAARAIPAAAALFVLGAAAILSNLAPLQDGAKLLQGQAVYVQAELETLNLSRRIVAPSYVSQGFIFGIVNARGWFTAEHALGSPPLSPDLLTRLPEFGQQAADSQLLKIQDLVLRKANPGTRTGTQPPPVDAAQLGRATPAGGCISFAPTAFTPPGAINALLLTVPPSGVLVRAGGAPATVGLRRFSPQFLPLGTLAPTAQATLTIKSDLAPQPWHVQIAAPGTFSVCTLG